ncbi:MAG: electron transfer flavoprotein subunit alpha/FixB family protein [Clostridiales bacterium]|nr:electron transfer flavoprotein subunit alpha/FixB family protein [Clostridiales bacterium]
MKIVVFCEKELSAALELIGKGRAIAPEATICALYEDRESCVPQLLASGADEALSMDRCVDDCAQGTRIAAALSALSPDIVLFPATVRGRFLSAWAAAKLDTGLTADCTELSLNADGLLLQTRPAFGGNLTADILCKESRPQIASVRPGVFARPEPQRCTENAGEPHSALTIQQVLQRMDELAFEPVEYGISLQTARVVVAGGKGIGSKKGFDKLHELADLLGGAVGATRSAVDAGWIDYEHQIGQTGVMIRPDLYFAFGISGIMQHVVGMSSAGTVISVNTDRNAPIFSCSDFGIIADWRETIDVIIEYIKKGKKIA